MSYTALIPFANGKPQDGIKFGNAWGGAARIWTALFNVYVPKKHQYDSWLSGSGDDKRLWDLAKGTKLAVFERATHVFTFDRFYVRNEHFGRFACDLRLFVELHPPGASIDHLPAWAEWLDKNPTVEAVGLHGTSVSENLWWRTVKCPHCGNSTDEMEPVPLKEGTEVYDWIENEQT